MGSPLLSLFFGEAKAKFGSRDWKGSWSTERNLESGEILEGCGVRVDGGSAEERGPRQDAGSLSPTVSRDSGEESIFPVMARWGG